MFLQLLIADFEGSNDVLEVIDQCCFEETIFSVKFQECEEVGLTEHLVAVHIKHLESEFLQESNMLLLIVTLLKVRGLRVYQHRFKSLIEHIVFVLAS